MKKIAVFVFFALLTTLCGRAELLFSDPLNYPNGLIETDGTWYAYSPIVPHLDAFVTNDLLILNQTNYDAVAAPTNGFVNNTGGTIVYGSFTINVSSLPTRTGGYFCVLQDTNSDQVGRVFIDTEGAVTPGTYRLGIANIATSIATGTNFQSDLATNITYQVIFSYDTNQSSGDLTTGANLWVNPSMDELVNVQNEVYATDSLQTITPGQAAIQISQIGFSQYANQGIMAIGNVNVGTAPGDFGFATVPAAPVIGIQPQSSTNFLGQNTALYVAASGIDETYQWYSNGVALVDNGATVVGSTTPVLYLTNLQATATYYAIVTDSANSTTSSNAVVGVNTVPTLPFFTLQPQGGTNSLDSPVTLTAQANGTGPITYQWYFEPSGGSSFSALTGQTSSSLSFTANDANSGAYYVTATGGAGSFNSTTVNVVIIAPPVVTIAYMHSFITNKNGNVSINGGQVFNVKGVVTSINQIESKTVSEFFIQDATGGLLVYEGTGNSPTNTPRVGTMVNVISPAESYYGELEMDPTLTAPTNAIITLSTNNPLPATIPLNLPLMATNTLATNYGLVIECSLVTMTNVYIYSTPTGTRTPGEYFTNNSAIPLYAFQQPYSAGEPYVEVYVYTYTNVANLSNTNYFGQPIPTFAYELTGVMGIYSPTTPELFPTRYQDFVTTPPASFSASTIVTNGTPTLTWPAVVGSTYSVYSATNILGPWTQTFGLSYYPSVGTYTPTNGATAQFFKVSTP